MKEIIIQIKNKLFETGFYHVFGSSVINKILSFLCSILVVRIVDKTDFGIYSYANNILSFFLVFTGLGMVSGLLQLCSEEHEEPSIRTKLFCYGCRIGSGFNLLIGFVILAVSLLIPLPIEGANRYLSYLAFYPVVLIINELQLCNFRYRLENQSFSYANTIWTALIVAGSILGALVFNIEGLIIGLYTAGVLSFLISKYILKGEFGLKRASISQEIKKVLYKISIISMLNNGLSELHYLIDIFLIGILITNPEIVASYKVATVIPVALNFIPIAFITYVYPYFARNKDNIKWTKKYYHILFITVFFVSLLIAIVAIAFAPQIIGLIFGKRYLDAVLCFRILCVSFVFASALKIVHGNLLVTQRKLTFNLIVSCASVVLNVAGNYILIGRYGAAGAAATTCMISVLTGLAATIYYNYVLKQIEKRES